MATPCPAPQSCPWCDELSALDGKMLTTTHPVGGGKTVTYEVGRLCASCSSDANSLQAEARADHD